MLRSSALAPAVDLVADRNSRLRIVNADPRYAPVALVEPTTLGYIHVAAEIAPRSLPFLPNDPKKSGLFVTLKGLARRLARLEAVERVTVYDGVAFPPAARLSPLLAERAGDLPLPRFDVVVLVETTSPASIHEVQELPAYRAIVDALSRRAKQMHVIAARNARRVGDVDASRQGLFLFNYFVAEDADVMLGLWEYLAGWYVAETGLDNSALLVPLDGQRSEYRAINHARWDGGLLGLMLRQMTKESFRTYVQANLAANRVGAMPMLYRLG